MMLIYPEKYLVPSRGDHRALTKQAVHQGQMLLSQTQDLQEQELPLSLLCRSSSLSKGAVLHSLPGAEGWGNPFWILGWG